MSASAAASCSRTRRNSPQIGYASAGRRFNREASQATWKMRFLRAAGIFHLKRRPAKRPSALPTDRATFEGAWLASMATSFSGRFSRKNFWAIGELTGIRVLWLQVGHPSYREDKRQIE